MQDIAIYPGSFDPITMGHIDVLERSLKIFKKVVVAIGESLKMVKGVTKGMNVSVEKFSGLLVDFAKSKKASVIIRGLRAVSDFDYEFQAALMNRKLNPEIETIFIMTRGKYCYLSSSVVKEVASRGGNMQHLVPEAVKKMLIGKFGKIK